MEDKIDRVQDSMECYYCKSTIPVKAKICSGCHRYQRWRIRNYLQNFGLVTASLLVLLGFLQFNEARKEHAKASEALKSAQDAIKTGEDLKKTLKDASNTLLNLQALTEFSDIVLRAHNGDAIAFDKLSDWANDKSYSYSSRAKEAMWAVFDKHGSGFWAVVPLEQYEDYHPSKIHNMKDIRHLYKKAESLIETFVKPSILQHMWNRKDIAEREKVDFLIEVITGDKSLAARETAGRLITEKLTKKGQIETHPLHKHIILKMAKEYRANL